MCFITTVKAKQRANKATPPTADKTMRPPVYKLWFLFHFFNGACRYEYEQWREEKKKIKSIEESVPTTTSKENARCGKYNRRNSHTQIVHCEFYSLLHVGNAFPQSQHLPFIHSFVQSYTILLGRGVSCLNPDDDVDEKKIIGTNILSPCAASWMCLSLSIAVLLSAEKKKMHASWKKLNSMLFLSFPRFIFYFFYAAAAASAARWIALRWIVINFSVTKL